MRFFLLQVIVYVCIFSSSISYSQLPDFFYQLPNAFKINETDESELIQNKNFSLDTFNYNNLSEKKDKYKVDYRLYKWECELYCYIDTITTKLEGIKIWNTPDNWESNGIKIDMHEDDFLNFLKRNYLNYSSYKCKFFNDYTVQTKLLFYTFSFPAEDNNSSRQECWNDVAHELEYAYVGARQTKGKGKTLTVTY